MPNNTRTTDSVRLAVLTNRMEGVVRAMMNTLLRSGRSGVLNTARDFSCCITTGQHELLATAESLPIHVMSGPDLMARSMVEFHDDLQPGDAFLHNSPYHGCSHAADQTVMIPVIAEGRHQFTVLAKAHQADIGNSEPTTYAASARDVYEEGALIFPCVRIQRDYVDNEDLIRMCRMRIRVPDQWWGDYLAALGAARIGERRLLELGAEVGWDALREYVEDWFDYSEHQMASAIERLPKGSVQVSGRHDPFPGVPDGVPVNAGIEVTDDRITIDLRDNIDALPVGLNLSEACSRTTAMVGVFNSIGPGVPPNAGSFRRLDVLLRDGGVVGRLQHPSSCSVATTNVADRVANAIQRGFAELGEGAGMAEAGLVQPASLAVISGRDPQRGNEPFVNQIFLAFTGGAGSPHSDGWLTICHVGNAGLILRDSVEIDESRFPIRVLRQELMVDTEGPGAQRGAPSAIVEYEAVGTDVTVFYASDGGTFPARGARGGGAGGASKQFKRVGTDLEELPAAGNVTIGPGEVIVSISCGGGGYGVPTDREPARVARDIEQGWITTDRARDAYGVVIDGAGGVDVTATAALRDAMRDAEAAAVQASNG